MVCFVDLSYCVNRYNNYKVIIINQNQMLNEWCHEKNCLWGLDEMSSRRNKVHI